MNTNSSIDIPGSQQTGNKEESPIILSVIIPAYNEEGIIAETIQRCIDVKKAGFDGSPIDGMEIIVVDDGSQDRTPDIAKEFGEQIKLVSHHVNRGYGAALTSGFHQAKGQLLSFLDGDGTCSPEEFPRLCREMEENSADLVVGMRIHKDSKMPFIRRLGNRFYAWTLRRLSGARVRDSASGMRVFKREILDKLEPLPTGLNYTPAMTTKAIHEDMVIHETPIPYDVRGGKSKLSVVKDGYWFLRIILDTVLLYNPLKVFSLIGLAFILVAIGLTFTPLYDWIMGATRPPDFYIFRLMGSVTFAVCGVNIIAFGIVASYMISVMFKKKGGYGYWLKIIKRRKLQERFGIIGLLMVLAGLTLFFIFAWQHFIGDGITIHWKAFLIGALLILAGSQLITASLLVKILKESDSTTSNDKRG